MSDNNDLAAKLTDMLGLDAADLRVTGAEVFGRGSHASVNLYLHDGSRIVFEKFSDVPKPGALSAHLVTTTGVWRAFKGAEAGAIAATIYALAQHHEEVSADDAASEWGAEFLRIAPTIELDMNDQSERWSAFSALAMMNPARDAGEDRSAFALAAASTVLVDHKTQTRYVRSGWFLSYVRREVGGLYSPAGLVAGMERVGWQRPNAQARVKASCPTDNREHSWSFYVIPPDWSTDNTQSYAVTPSYSTNAREKESSLTRVYINTRRNGVTSDPEGQQEDDPGETLQGRIDAEGFDAFAAEFNAKEHKSVEAALEASAADWRRSDAERVVADLADHHRRHGLDVGSYGEGLKGTPVGHCVNPPGHAEHQRPHATTGRLICVLCHPPAVAS